MKKIIVVFLLSILFFIGLVVFQPYVYTRLAITQKINADNLLVEGWLSRYNAKRAFQEYTAGNYKAVITTGQSVPDYYSVVMNGFLVFDTKELFKSDTTKLTHTFDLVVYGELGGEHSAHVGFYLNDVLHAEFYAAKRKKSYGYMYSGALADIDSLMIAFDNDAMGDFGDVNLYVKEIIVDDTLHISFKNHSIYNRTARGWERRIPLDYETYAGRARNYFIDLGLDEANVIAVPGEGANIHRTLSSALSFKEWLENSGESIESINILTVGAHARRTQMIYRKVLEGHCEVGIVALSGRGRVQSFFYTYKELIGIVYFSAILMFY